MTKPFRRRPDLQVEVVSDGIGLAGAFLLLFVALKLTRYISWSWFWVLSPAWLALALALAIVIIVLLIVFASELLHRLRLYLRRKKGKQ